MGLASTECSDADLRPVIDINKVADLRGVENEGPKETLARETDEESKSPCSIKGRPSTRASGFVEPAPKASRGTKRTLDMDMGEPEAPPTGSSKRLKLIEHQGPASIGLRRSARTAQSASAASQGPFDQSSSNSSLPKTPRDRSSILIPPVRIGETTSQDSVGGGFEIVRLCIVINELFLEILFVYPFTYAAVFCIICVRFRFKIMCM